MGSFLIYKKTWVFEQYISIKQSQMFVEVNMNIDFSVLVSYVTENAHVLLTC